MKISCEIIKDLLPLYHDDVCSLETKAMVEEHLAECNECKNELDIMDIRIVSESKESKLLEAESLQKLSKKWKASMIKSIFEGAIGTFLIIVIFFLIIFIFFEVHIG